MTRRRTLSTAVFSLLSACATAFDAPDLTNDGAASTPLDAAAGSLGPDARDASDASDASAGHDAATVVLVDAATASPDAPVPSCAQPASGTLATWSFAGAPGNQASTAAATYAPGATASALSRVGVTATSGSGSINSSSWTTATQLDAGKYYTLSLTPPIGCTLTLTGASIDGKSSASGPTQAVITTSADGFSSPSTVATTAPSTPSLAVTAATGAVELRVYGFAAGSASGTFRLQNTLTLSGSIQ